MWESNKEEVRGYQSPWDAVTHSYQCLPLGSGELDEAGPGLYRRMLGFNVEEGGGWSLGGARCVAAGGGREERGEMRGREQGRCYSRSQGYCIAHPGSGRQVRDAVSLH